MIEGIIGTKLSGKHSRTRRRGFHRSELLSYLIAAYWRALLGELQTQAEEVRALSTKVADDVAKPIKDA